MSTIRLSEQVGARLRERARELELSDAEVARRSGLQPRRYGNYVSGERQMDYDTLMSVCETLRISPNELLSFRGHAAGWDERPDEAEARSVPEHYVALPFVQVSAGMGGGAVIDGEGQPEEARVFFPPDVIRALRAAPEQLRVMTVSGPSMSPVLESGDQVIVDLGQTNPSQPAIFVLWDGYGLVCKWVERVPLSDPPKIRIISENQRFKPYEATAEEILIIGRVVWFARAV
jgi:phage repressor protein C with HTH and peptisase S24 domain